MAVEAKTTITTENNNPKVKPKITLQIINPKAIKLPILRMFPKNEKSLPVVKATVVIPANVK